MNSHQAIPRMKPPEPVSPPRLTHPPPQPPSHMQGTLPTSFCVIMSPAVVSTPQCATTTGLCASALPEYLLLNMVSALPVKYSVALSTCSGATGEHARCHEHTPR